MNPLMLTPETMSFNFVMIALVFFATGLHKLKGIETPGPDARQWAMMILAGLMFFVAWLVT